MAIIRWNPIVPRWSNWNLPGLLDEEWPEMTVTEGLNVYETEGEVVVEAAMPGIPSDKVDVTFEDGVLRISGKHEESEEEKKRKKVVYRSARVASFDYTTTLPRAIDPNKIEANVNNGVLTIKAPIAKEAKPKKIAVKTSSSK